MAIIPSDAATIPGDALKPDEYSGPLRFLPLAEESDDEDPPLQLPDRQSVETLQATPISASPGSLDEIIRTARAGNVTTPSGINALLGPQPSVNELFGTQPQFGSLDEVIKATRAGTFNPAGAAAQTGAAALSNFGDGFGFQSYVPPAAPDTFADLKTLLAADEDKDSLTNEEVEKLLPGLPKDDPASFLARMDDKTLSNEEADQLGAQLNERKKVNVGDAIRQGRPQQAPSPMSAVPQTPDSMIRGAIGKFANPLMLMALTAGALTKQPALNALAAATGVLEGMNQKDWQKTYLQQNKFRNSVKQTIDQQQLEISDINSVLHSDEDPTTKIGKLDALAQQYGDPIVSDFARKQDFKGLQEFMDGRQKALDGLHKAKRGHDKTSENVQKYAQQEESIVDLVGKGEMNPPSLNTEKGRDFMAKVMKKYRNYNPATDSPAAKKQAQRLELREAGVPADFDETKPLPKGEDLAISYAEGNQRAAMNLPKQLSAMVKERGAWLATRPEELAAAKKGLVGLTERTKEFAGGMAASQTAGRIEGRIVSALTRAEAAAPIVINLSERVNRSEFPDINSIFLSGKQRIGDVAVPEFRTALQTLVLNYAQAVGGGAQGAVTVDAAKHARELLDIAFSKGQVRATVRQMLFEIDRELAGAKRGVGISAGTMSAAPKDEEQEAYEWAIQNLRDPRAQQMLKNMGL